MSTPGNALNITQIGLVKFDGFGNFTGVTTVAHSVLVGAFNNGITSITAGINGQVLIGSTGNDPSFATLTGTGGITFTTGAGSLVINNTANTMTWSTITDDQTAAVNNAYVCNKAGLLTLTLPAVSAVGDGIKVTGINNATGWKVAQNAGNTINFVATQSTPGGGGSIASSSTYDTVELRCVTANALWTIVDSTGNITFV
jgi:hypothetical protein